MDKQAASLQTHAPTVSMPPCPFSPGQLAAVHTFMTCYETRHELGNLVVSAISCAQIVKGEYSGAQDGHGTQLHGKRASCDLLCMEENGRNRNGTHC